MLAWGDRRQGFIIYPSRKIPYFASILLKKGHFKIFEWIGTYKQKNTILWSSYGFSCHNYTIFYVCPKIFINRTIFAKFMSHFFGQVQMLFVASCHTKWCFAMSRAIFNLQNVNELSLSISKLIKVSLTINSNWNCLKQNNKQVVTL